MNFKNIVRTLMECILRTEFSTSKNPDGHIFPLILVVAHLFGTVFVFGWGSSLTVRQSVLVDHFVCSMYLFEF